MANENKKCRSWCFTLNNYVENDEELIKAIPHKYLVFGRETAPTTNTRHLQGFIMFENACKFNTVRSHFNVCSSLPHIELAKGTAAQNRTYCMKDGDFFEEGTVPLTSEEKGLKEQERWISAKANAMSGNIDVIDADIYIRCYSALKHIKRDHMPSVVDAANTCGIWIYGPAGCGKSSWARRTFPGAFLKPINKWWDGYDNEDTVIMDDIDPKHKEWIGYFLKMWTDRYAFIAEQKGTSIKIRPTHFIITSQYSIEEIFGDTETVQAITRRCKIFNMSNELDLQNLNATVN